MGDNRLTSLDLTGKPSLEFVSSDGNVYPVAQCENVSCASLPGTFDIGRVPEVTGGSFDAARRTRI